MRAIIRLHQELDTGEVGHREHQLHRIQIKANIGKFIDNWAQSDPIGDDESEEASIGPDYEGKGERPYVFQSVGDTILVEVHRYGVEIGKDSRMKFRRIALLHHWI